MYPLELGFIALYFHRLWIFFYLSLSIAEEGGGGGDPLMMGEDYTYL